jgi:hypothetical protein
MFLFHETCPTVLCLIKMSSMKDVVFLSELLPLHFLLHISSSLARYVHICRLNMKSVYNFRKYKRTSHFTCRLCLCLVRFSEETVVIF